MRNTLILAVVILFSAALAGCKAEPAAVVLVSDAEAQQPAADQAVVPPQPREAAVALLASLTGPQREQATRPIASPLRKDWHYVPRQREGVMLGDLDPAQKKRVHALMQTALSDSGYLKATDIIWLETVLYEMSNQNPMRDPGKYALLIFGDPTDKDAAWGWRLEGHHLSLNMTYTAQGIGVTPLFFGTNPAVVQQGPLAGKRVLADEHHLALRLAQSMSAEQREKMMLDGKPRDIITGPGREASLKTPAGIAKADLTDEQQSILLYLSSAYGHNIAGDHQLVRVAKLIDEGTIQNHLDLSFAWAGPTDGSGPFYYRIHSPDRVIEYSCQGKNHVHSVIHDLTDPLQDDLLKHHFEQHEHGGD